MDKDNKSILADSIITYPNIDWGMLAKAQQYYQQNFLYQETPFIVPESYNKLTKPHYDPSFFLTHGLFENSTHELVGSAEQGFIYLALENQLKANKLFSISPCFRTENYDHIHFPWFMKLELFHVSNNSQDMFDMLDFSYSFFKSQRNGHYEIIQTGNESWDILLDNIEIGSYGIRRLEQLEFIYGTGLALPRFSQTGNSI